MTIVTAKRVQKPFSIWSLPLRQFAAPKMKHAQRDSPRRPFLHRRQCPHRRQFLRRCCPRWRPLNPRRFTPPRRYTLQQRPTPLRRLFPRRRLTPLPHPCPHYQLLLSPYYPATPLYPALRHRCLPLPPFLVRTPIFHLISPRFRRFRLPNHRQKMATDGVMCRRTEM